VEHVDRVEAVARELEALDEAVRSGDMDAPVPTCSGWTVADLASHVGEFCAFWTHVLCEGAGRPKTPYPDAPEGDALAGWLATLGENLLTELRAVPEETAVWTWFDDDQTARFVARRSVHELALHRYDAQSARGAPRPIDPAVAADGIDEILGALITLRERTGNATGQTLHLHGTDDDRDGDGEQRHDEWLVTLHPSRIEVARTHAKGDLALRGAVSDLELLLYGRPSLGEVQRFGDQSVLDQWYQEFTF
jgi:uncharacterized protein (TIGR03083 family)